MIRTHDNCDAVNIPACKAGAQKDRTIYRRNGGNIARNLHGGEMWLRKVDQGGTWKQKNREQTLTKALAFVCRASWRKKPFFKGHIMYSSWHLGHSTNSKQDRTNERRGKLIGRPRPGSHDIFVMHYGCQSQWTEIIMVLGGHCRGDHWIWNAHWQVNMGY